MGVVGFLLALILLVVLLFQRFGWTGGPDANFSLIWLTISVVLMALDNAWPVIRSKWTA